MTPSARIKNLIQILCFLMTCLLAWLLVSSWLTPQDGTAYSTKHYKTLKRNSVDALFIGASNYWDGVSPLILWERTGVTSYVFASSNNPPQVQLLMLKEALETQKPRVVFFSTQFLVSRQKPDQISLRLIQGFTNQPFNLRKLQMAAHVSKDVYPKAAIEAMAPLLAYHDNWKDVEEVTFVREEPVFTMGQRCTYFFHRDFTRTTDELVERVNNPKKRSDVINETAARHYREAIALCKSKGIRVVLMSMPLYHYYINGAAVERFAKEQGVDSLNFNEEQHLRAMDIDHTIEWRDHFHLNFWGSVKFSDYLSRIMKEKYDLPDHRKTGDVVAKEWLDHYRQFYRQYINWVPGEMKPPGEVLQ